MPPATPPDHPTRDAGFGIYLHWPFCAAKCPYCDFNSHVRHAGVDQPRFLAAFRREIAHAAALAPGRTVTSIFLGGGTPSLMAPDTVAGLLDAVAGAWSVAPDAEVTLEANPTSVEATRFRGYRAAGVNRVSLGVQALDDGDLKRLGRLHSVAEALDAVRTASAHFERFSFDLIYARPEQTPEAWAAELRRAIDYAAEHLSLYQLTIEPGTPFFGLAQAGRLVPPDDDASRALYDVTQEICGRAGLPAYEISNHARPGAQSRHNLLYWRYGEYAGIGPGAHGRLVLPQGRTGTLTEKAPEDWLARVERDGHGIVETETLSAEDQGDEFLMMGLRLTEGIDSARYASLKGRPLHAGRLDALARDGLVARRPDGRIAATARGAPVLNAVVAELAG
ncbi:MULTISPECIES: radical SAM family heme chaperone HemW [Methylorubrum]|jgi:putative oxygen-independent coproporphyrinogen III oxidase|uniref:Heme chaperone HemW n=2 Tax=Methylorubrum extorquens TaxID=408 RepID=C5AS36_METEA|nr:MULTISPECIES: radical SAM family heme chaperone HemW [Methylorubrum]ACS38271.1 putative oxidase [Methylorubrum extorquens AM1]EHP89934.1 oxygen-independent coproporphyrinogen III oxidase [Methylorubrum extorquens DSM 13060]MCP1543678.1 oxygen-independent coproporphyrinogen-3 oxidase [Methylorubrum extorquens]MCP1588977.1 oxygen-independent coproporphyrinogen-3 oxidase [Methylorubrum extorquens]BDL37802.1 coproporphyrinogen III oxidase [Methylorubrum sp. GM97]